MLHVAIKSFQPGVNGTVAVNVLPETVPGTPLMSQTIVNGGTPPEMLKVAVTLTLFTQSKALSGGAVISTVQVGGGGLFNPRAKTMLG
jgi:hypothetical protein